MNQILPSGPIAIPHGEPAPAGRKNCFSSPVGIRRPIALPPMFVPVSAM